MNLTGVRSILKQLTFNPNKDEYKIICDHSDPQYYVRRSLDLLRESLDAPDKIKEINYKDAARLLVVASMKHDIQKANRK